MHTMTHTYTMPHSHHGTFIHMNMYAYKKEMKDHLIVLLYY